MNPILGFLGFWQPKLRSGGRGSSGILADRFIEKGAQLEILQRAKKFLGLILDLFVKHIQVLDPNKDR